MPEPIAIAPELPTECWGTIMAVQANYYWVKLDDPLDSLPPSAPRKLLCTRRARLKKMGQQVMVGDRVQVEEVDWIGSSGAIAQVLPRKTVLDRPPIANVDQILLVFALAEPQLDPHQLSRFLIKAESTGLQVCLCLNKGDLVETDIIQNWRERLHQWGYDPIVMSLEATGVSPELAQQLNDRITVVSGPSGVGKSSLINQLIPRIDLRTGAVSGKLGRGRHTTRHIELFELPTGGLLADSPGFNQPDVTCSPEAVAQCFPEIRQRLSSQACQFTDCLHRDEPGCAVGQDWERYEHYLLFLEEAEQRQAALNQQRDPETAFKLKTTEAGRLQQEPKLQAKKYRRVSRRERKQALQDLRNEITDSAGNLDDLDGLVLDGLE